MSKPRYIAHTGGKQPVADNVRIEAVFRDRFVCGEWPARMWMWVNVGNETDIIAYRVIK